MGICGDGGNQLSEYYLHFICIKAVAAYDLEYLAFGHSRLLAQVYCEQTYTSVLDSHHYDTAQTCQKIYHNFWEVVLAVNLQ